MQGQFNRRFILRNCGVLDNVSKDVQFMIDVTKETTKL